MYNYTTSDGIHIDGVKQAVESYKDSRIGDDLIVEAKDRALKGEDFMKILTFQLQNQNPMEPMSSNEMLGQISSLNSLKLSESLELFTRSQNSTLGHGFLGKSVEIETIDASGRAKIVSGVVSSISDLGRDSCRIIVNGKSYKPTEVVKINSYSVGNDATSLLGKYVVIAGDTNAEEGIVTAVLAPNTDSCKVVINGKQYSADEINEIRTNA